MLEKKRNVAFMCCIPSHPKGRMPGLPVNGKGEGFETIGRIDLFPEVWWTGKGQGVVARVGESLLLF